MNPDLEKRVPREILEELIEEGTEAFRGILEKLFNVAMRLERSEFLGAEAYERTQSRRGYRNGFKGMGRLGVASGFRLEWESCGWRFPRCAG